jgi:ParB family transcriptional regulator, chromosome partitioning protein
MTFPYDATSRMRRLYPKEANLAPAQRKRSKKVQQELRKLRESEDDWTPETEMKIEQLEAEYDALERAGYSARDKAKAGVVVAISHNGGLRIECGLVHPDHEPKKKPKKKAAAEGKADGPSLSAKLVTELTAYRTMGLRNALAKAPNTAFAALVHALVQNAFHLGRGFSCLGISMSSAPLGGYGNGIDDSPASQEIAARHAKWAARLPEDPADLRRFIGGLSIIERDELLSHCVALSIDAVRLPKTDREPNLADAETLADELSLDMTAVWQPTAASYFSRVSKEAILEAVREAAGEDAAKRIASLKKSAMAQEAEKLVAGKGWLPPILRPAAG